VEQLALASDVFDLISKLIPFEEIMRWSQTAATKDEFRPARWGLVSSYRLISGAWDVRNRANSI